MSSSSTPTASITGAAPNQVLNLQLPKGDQGDVGPAAHWLGHVATAGLLPAGPWPPGGMYLTDSDGHVWTWDPVNNRAVDGGVVKGPAGETLKIGGTAASADLLPATPAPLTVILDTDTKGLWIYDPSNTAAATGPAAPGVPADPGPPPVAAVPAQPPAGWVGLGSIEGPKGDPGPAGSGIVVIVDDTALPTAPTSGQTVYNVARGALQTWDGTGWGLAGQPMVVADAASLSQAPQVLGTVVFQADTNTLMVRADDPAHPGVLLWQRVGALVLNDLSDVSVTGATTGQVLAYGTGGSAVGLPLTCRMFTPRPRLMRRSALWCRGFRMRPLLLTS